MYAGTQERLFDTFLIFFALICPGCLNKQGNVSFDLVGFVLLPKSPIFVLGLHAQLTQA